MDERVNELEMSLDEINFTLEDIGNILRGKCKAYGASALFPIVRIWPEIDAETGLKARFQDKLARLATSSPGDQEDALLDVVGYGVLLLAARKLKVRT